MRLLFTVEDVFTIPGRGVVLTPELVPVGREVFRNGDPLRLRRPDGSEDIVNIGGLGFAKVLNSRCQVLIFLRDKSKADVPVGTGVWSVIDQLRSRQLILSKTATLPRDLIRRP